MEHRPFLITEKVKKSFSIRWDNANLADYYDASRIFLNSFVFDCNLVHCKPGSKCVDYFQFLNISEIQNITKALCNAERLIVSRIPHSALRSFWNEETR